MKIFAAILVISIFSEVLPLSLVDAAEPAGKPAIVKLGTVDIDLVETTPIVFRNELYRFESVRARYHANKAKEPYFRFVTQKTGVSTPAFAEGHELGCAFTHDGIMYAFGVPSWGASTIRMFWSRDLQKWESAQVIEQPGWELFNCSVCRAGDRFVMAFEVGAPPQVVGVRFTNRFAESSDLRSWKVLPEPAVFTKEKYSASPTLRYYDGWFYLVYLEALGDYRFNPFLVRSRDLAIWHASKCNPLLGFDDADKNVANAALSSEARERIADAKNSNNSDVDFCQWQSRVVINYSWGDQRGTEFLAEAYYEGTERQMLESAFP